MFNIFPRLQVVRTVVPVEEAPRAAERPARPDPPEMDRGQMPLPEVSEGNTALDWLRWERAVAETDALLAAHRAAFEKARSSGRG